MPPPRWKPKPPASIGSRWIGEPERAAMTVYALVGVVMAAQEVVDVDGVLEVPLGAGTLSCRRPRLSCGREGAQEASSGMARSR